MRRVVCLFILLMLVTPVAAHSQNTFTLLLKGDGPTPGNVSNGVVQGDSIWFWMVDSTNNSSMVVSLEKGNITLTSTNLTKSCELNEDGNKSDPDCQVRFDVLFNLTTDLGEWDMNIERWVNNESNGSWQGSIVISEDNHVEPGGPPGLGSCFGTDCEEEIQESVSSNSNTNDGNKSLIIAIAVISGIGVIGLGLSLLRSEARVLREFDEAIKQSGQESENKVRGIEEREEEPITLQSEE